jgi:hypothetical protein
MAPEIILLILIELDHPITCGRYGLNLRDVRNSDCQRVQMHKRASGIRVSGIAETADFMVCWRAASAPCWACDHARILGIAGAGSGCRPTLQLSTSTNATENQLCFDVNRLRDMTANEAQKPAGWAFAPLARVLSSVVVLIQACTHGQL